MADSHELVLVDTPLVVAPRPTEVSRRGPGLPNWVLERVAIERVDAARKAMELLDTILAHFEHGKKQVWVIYLTLDRVEVHESKTMRAFRQGASLEGGDALPGFSVPVTELYGLLGIELPPPDPRRYTRILKR